MKKLVLGSLALALVATQATGCIITTDDDDDDGDFAIITAEWEFRNISTSSVTPCPSGFGTVALHNQEIDSVGDPIGSPVIDLFDCADGIHDSAPLDPAIYDTWLEVTNGSGSQLYAESLTAEVDVRTADKTFSAKIYNDGGYFLVGWNLRAQSDNRPLSCADVADLDGVEIIATLSGSTAAVVDQFDCARGFDYSGELRAGTYEVSVDAFRDGTPDVALGPPVTLSGRRINDRNQVTDLGDVTLLITNP